MTLSWEEFKKKKQEDFGLEILQINVPKVRYEESKPESPRRLFNIHKRSIPPGIDTPVIYNIPSKELAENTIEKATDDSGNRLFNTRLYNDDTKSMKTYIFYEPVPTDATPKERSIYFNPPETRRIKGE